MHGMEDIIYFNHIISINHSSKVNNENGMLINIKGGGGGNKKLSEVRKIIQNISNKRNEIDITSFDCCSSRSSVSLLMIDFILRKL